MECTVKTNEGRTIRIPLEHGYRDEDAIREAEENEHRILRWSQGYWNVVIDMDAGKALQVMSRIGQYNGI